MAGAVTYNEFVFGSAPLWDLERIEVFRSPQTTTQGRIIAGAIFINTADPTYDYQARLRAIGGQAHTRQISGVVSGPLAADQLAFRSRATCASATPRASSAVRSKA